MKPLATVPEIQGTNLKIWDELRATTGEPIFELEGLVQGKKDAGFLYQGVLFRLVTPG